MENVLADPLRICWIENGSGLFSDSVSGGSMRLREVAERWRRQAYCDQFMITTPGGDEIHRRMGLLLPGLVLRASLFLRKEHSRAGRLWSYLVTVMHFRSRCSEVPAPDVIITASDYFCDVIPALRLKRAHPRAKWVAWVHHRELPASERPGNYLLNTFTAAMQRWSFRRIARHADSIWTYASPAGTEVAQELVRSGAGEQKLYGMKNGVDLEAAVSARASGEKADAVMIGLRPNKGLHDIIPVWERVQKKRPGTKLKLVGRPADVEQELKKIGERGLDKVIRFLRPADGKSFVFKEALYGELKSARVLFAPSREEGWGITVCEGMACGLPVVAYDLPVYRRIYGDAIATVPVGDHERMATRLCEVLDDATTYETLLRLGTECSKRYEWSRLADEDWETVTGLVSRTDADAKTNGEIGQDQQD